MRSSSRTRSRPALSACCIAKHTILLEELADATLDGNRRRHVELLTTVPLLIIDDLGMPDKTAADCRRRTAGNHHAALRERTSTLISASNRPVDGWGQTARR